VLALFDLDGTLTRHDTLPAYLRGFLRAHPKRWRRLPRALPAVLRFLLGRADHGELKSALITAVMGGFTRSEIDEWTARFVPQLIGYGLFGDALTALEGHRGAGDYLVLLSASPDIYVAQIGRALGFDQTLCTGFAWEAERLTGALTTANRRGAEKVRCLEALRLQQPKLPVVAYGNAASDVAHLKLADLGVLVNGSLSARHKAAHAGIARLKWR
jgi:phosphatidylglycerophosphatase C